MRLIILSLIWLAPTGGPVPPISRVASPFTSDCPEYMCSFTQGGEEECHSTGEVIWAGPACTATCDFGQWRLDCG